MPSLFLLSKRLSEHKIASPRYKQSSHQKDNTIAIAIDSTGLKPYDRNGGVEMSGTRKNTCLSYTNPLINLKGIVQANQTLATALSAKCMDSVTTLHAE